jgi:hypothetical protein
VVNHAAAAAEYVADILLPGQDFFYGKRKWKWTASASKTLLSR